jgi:hypothetical protein
MPRGGARLGAGAKSKWKHGETKTIRVPKQLEQQVLEYARKLDGSAILETDTESKIINLSSISVTFYKNRPIIYLEDLVKAGYEILPSALAKKVKALNNKTSRT